MKRSGSVTVASIAIIVVSALVASGAFFAAFTTALLQAVGPRMPTTVFARSLAFGMAVLSLAVWGIASGVGLLRLRRWAWFSTLVIGALLVVAATPGIFTARKLIRATTGVPTVGAGSLVAFEYMGLAFTTLVPLAFAIWWLVVFTRRSARAQFAPGVALDPPYVSAPHPHPPFVLTSPPAAGTMPLASPRMQLSYRRPVSITVIAVLLLAGAASIPLLLLIPSDMRMTMMFGVIVAGREMILTSILWGGAAIALGIGLLLLKPWARLGTIVYFLTGMMNGVLTALHMTRLMDAMQKAMGIKSPVPVPPIFQHVMAVIGAIFAVGLNLAAIYFLVARRGAFRTPPPSVSATNAAAPLGTDSAAPYGG